MSSSNEPPKPARWLAAHGADIWMVAVSFSLLLVYGLIRARIANYAAVLRWCIAFFVGILSR